MFKYYISYSTYRNVVNTFLALLFIFIILFSLFLSAVFSDLTIKQTSKISSEMLSRLVYMANQVYNEATSIVHLIGSGQNYDINIMMFNPEHDRLREYSGMTYLKELQANYSAISYIGVYNGLLDELSCTIGLTDETKNYLREEIKRNYEDFSNKFLLPMSNSIVTDTYDPVLNTLTLVYYSPLSKPDRMGATYIGINCEYLGEYISAINDQDFQTSFLLDAKGTVLAHPQKSEILADFSYHDYVKTIINSDEKSGSLTAEIDGNKFLVTFIQDEKTKWSFLTLMPHSEILPEINAVKSAIIIVSAIIILIGVCLFLFVTKKTFNPLANLLANTGYNPDNDPEKKKNEIYYLNERFSNFLKSSTTNKALLFDFTLEVLLKGELNEEKAKFLEDNSDILNSPYFCLCLIRIKKNPEEVKNENTPDNYILLSEISKECLMPMGISTHSLFLNYSNLAIILKLSSGALPSGLVLALMEIQKVFKSKTDGSTIISIGSVCEDIYSLQDSYENALELLNEYFFEPAKSIFMSTKRKVIYKKYNTHIENELLYALQANDNDKINQAVQSFIEEIKTVSYNTACLYIGQFTINIITRNLNQLPNMSIEKTDSYRKALANSETLDKANEKLLHLCEFISSLHVSGDSENHDKINQSIRLIKENYKDPFFSINIASEAVSLSPVYFNRIFRQKMNKSFSAYLNDYRLDKACMLLNTTKNSIKSISESIGILNDSYFYTLFKKAHGITPYQFRIKNSVKKSY